ncbi:MAG: ABC transporter ATP-binding protein [Clostridia bacterium]|nr:ABC transporter ATP-binding protein [Clostridia bacterium]
MALLEIKDLKVSYGLINAVKGVSFEVNEGEIVALIGANGAGKTTIMHAINGLIPVDSGSIQLGGVELTKIAPHKIVSLGLTQVPEGRRVFQELTVKDNLILGAYSRKNKAEIEKSLESVYEKFPRLKERENQVAGTLSGGEQQMLAVGRALMAEPKILLLDEPSMGLSPLFVGIIFDTIKEINKAGTTIFVVEQNAKKALSIADRAYVLETGRIAMSGTGEELINDQRVKSAYLGE